MTMMILTFANLWLLFSIVGLSGAVDDAAEEIRPLTDDEMRMSEEAGYSYADRLAQMEEDLLSQGVFVKDTNSYRSKMSQFKRPTRESMELARKSNQMVGTTLFIKDQLGLPSTRIERALNDTCLTAPTCNATKYRSIDGSCNNLAVTNLGQSSTVYRRLLPPVYADGIQAARNASKDGSALPSARLVSSVAFGDANVPVSSATLLVMQFGQFVNHDMEFTQQFAFSDGTGIVCCSSKNEMLPESQLSPHCLPIPIPKEDKIFAGQSCMDFVRSITGPRLNCSQALGYVDQLNANTHWLDGSTVYGSTDARMKRLRANTGGLLAMSNDTDPDGKPRTLLPVTASCTTGACFLAGDTRATEQPQLAVMHTIWGKEHNRVAKELAALNPTWSDEVLFQEARRIVIAEMQHITYNEFLPILLGPATVAQYGLAPLTSGYITNFTNYTSGPISNEFATAAFRMGHSLVQGIVHLVEENGTEQGTYNMSDFFFHPLLLKSNKSFVDNVIRGLVTQPSQAVDHLVTNELRVKLFRERNARFGFDLVALNTQRGRDHGLPDYNTYRQFCGLSKLAQFSDLISTEGSNLDPLVPIIPPELAGYLKETYATVDDIDLYVGGLMEVPTSSGGGLVGPTFACLMGENFEKLKYGDRFFYEMGGQPHSFTIEQLNEIRRASMARILCDNNDGSVLSMQPKAFHSANESSNAKVLCADTSAIPSLNLTFWQDEKLSGSN